MTEGLAGALATLMMRASLAFLPVSLKNFTFNTMQLTEVKEAFAANASRALLVSWLPMTVAVSSAMAAAKSRGLVAFLPFIGALVVVVLISLLVWCYLPVRWLRRGWCAPLIACLLSCGDFGYFALLQDRVVFALAGLRADATKTLNAPLDDSIARQPGVDSGMDD